MKRLILSILLASLLYLAACTNAKVIQDSSLSCGESSEQIESSIYSSEESLHETSQSQADTTLEEISEITISNESSETSSENTTTEDSPPHETSQEESSIAESQPTISQPEPEPDPSPSTSEDASEPEKDPVSDECYYTNIDAAIDDFNANNTRNGNEKDEDSVAMLSDGTITLLQDVTTTQNLIFNETGTLNLNKYTLTLKSGSRLLVNKSVTLTVIGEGSIVTKNASDAPIRVQGELVIESGTFNIADSKGLILASGGKVVINDGKFIAQSDNTNTYIINAQDGAYLTINNGTFSLSANSGQHYIIKAANQSLINTGCITINGGVYTAECAQGIVRGVSCYNINQTQINKGTITVKTVKESGLLYVDAVALDFSQCASVQLNGGKFIALQTQSSDNMDSKALTVYEAKNLVINGGEYYGQFSDICCPTTINDGVFSGIYVGLQLHGDYSVVVNGGIFESPWHGGIYVSNSNTTIKNATLGAPKYSDSYMAKSTNYIPRYEDNTIYSGTFYSCIYIGGLEFNVKCNIDSCNFAHTDNLRDGNIVTLTTNHGNKSSEVHVSNINAPNGCIRVDGTNTNGDTGTLYIGENVNIKGITGSGIVQYE